MKVRERRGERQEEKGVTQATHIQTHTHTGRGRREGEDTLPGRGGERRGKEQ